MRYEGNPEKFRLNIKQTFTKIVASLKNITSYIIDLIIVFIVQTIFIPLLTFWGLLKIARTIFRRFSFNVNGIKGIFQRT